MVHEEVCRSALPSHQPSMQLNAGHYSNPPEVKDSSSQYYPIPAEELRYSFPVADHCDS